MKSEERQRGLVVDGRYRIEGTLGRGAMGTVHRATDIGLERPVALKIISAELAVEPRSVERFQAEARGLATVRHPHVVEIYAYGPHERTHYFAMEYVAGANLEAVIEEHYARGRAVPLDRALRVLRQVASGLAAVHAKGLVHRDVKPANIVMEEGTGRPVLVDFGLVLKMRRVDARESFGGGTPSYMAPEQVVREDGQTITRAADVYALACTAWEVLTGRTVFVSSDLVELLGLHRHAAPPRISDLRAELAPADAVFARALAKAPGARYAGCEEFVTALEAALAPQLVAFARTIPRQSEEAAVPARPPRAARALVTLPPEPRRLTPLRAGTAGAAAVVALAVLGFACAWRPSSSAEARAGLEDPRAHAASAAPPSVGGTDEDVPAMVVAPPVEAPIRPRPVRNAAWTGAVQRTATRGNPAAVPVAAVVSDVASPPPVEAPAPAAGQSEELGSAAPATLPRVELPSPGEDDPFGRRI